MLDLALAVDRGVGHHRDGLLEVVGEVLALRGERRERPVVAQRADRLGAVRRHLLAELHVVALPAEAGQDPVGDLDRLGRAGRRVARDLGPLQRPTGLERPIVRRHARGDRPELAVGRLRTGIALPRPGPVEPSLGDGALHREVLVEARGALFAIDRDHELLAGAERLGLGGHVLAPDHAGLGAEDEVVRRLELPERAQAERIGREHALVVVAGDQRNRALSERPHRLAQVRVEGVQVGGQRADLVDDGRDDHLHRLGEREPLDPDQRVDDAVQVLRVRRAGVDRHAQHASLLAELLDRVDLAVVAEHGERLNAPKRRPGVGRVAVVPEAADRLEALVAEVRVVLAQHLRRSHHLVDAGRGRERGDVAAQLGLEREHQVEGDPRAPPGVREQPGDLPEMRLLLAGDRSERLGVDRPEPLGEDSEPASAEDLTGVVARLLDVLAPIDEQVRDGERGIEGERRVMAAGSDLLGPDPVRDVHQDAAAVSLAVDVPGPVEHLLEVDQRQLHRRAIRRRILSHRGVDGAGVAVLHAWRRDPRAIGPFG